MDLIVAECTHDHDSDRAEPIVFLIVQDTSHSHKADYYIADFLGMAMNLRNFAVSQYLGYKFNSLCKIGDTIFGANENGIFSLSGDNDTEVEISAFVELGTDFGEHHQKSLRAFYLFLQANGDMLLTLTPNDGTAVAYDIDVNLKSLRRESIQVPVRSYPKARYWGVRLENQRGCDFSLDSIEVLPLWRSRRPEGG